MERRNRYYARSRISERKFRQLLRYFAMDFSATDVAQLIGIRRKAVTVIFLKIRQRLAEECQRASPFSGEVEVDECDFGARRVRGKRGRGASGKTPVFGLLKRNGKVYTRIGELWASTNSGGSYSKVGNTISTTSTTLKTASFAVNNPGLIRFSLRKVSGGANRLNFDNITISAYTTPPPPTGEHLTMGNPSNAATNINQPTNYLLDKPQYAVSYNRDLGRPNWVSWHLDSSWIGSTPRQDDFRNDTTLPAGWYQVKATDYSGSGFDRGHHCPSGDRTNTVASNSATFLMTNIR